MRTIYHLFAFALFYILHQSRGEYSCDSDWKLVGDICIGVYSKTDEKTTWHQAKDKCHKRNSTLVTIRTEMKKNLLGSIFRGDAWIDLIRDSSSDNFRWANPPYQLDFTAWQSGQPNNGGEGCATLLAGYQRGYWADKACYLKYYYICEAPSGTNGCLPDWVQMAGKCYSFSNTTATWYEGREICQKSNGDLAIIENVLRNDMIKAKINSQSRMRYRTFWIGASDVKEEGKWKWLDQADEMQFQNWVQGSPDNANNGIHGCVYMPSTYRSNGAWKTQNCDVFYPAVCERRPVYSNVSTTCEDNWKLYRNESCIGIYPNASSWAGSRKKCKQLGGDLVVVKDSGKSRFVRRDVVNRARNRIGWIGMTDNNQNGEWNWLDSTEKATFLDWYTGYPRENLMRKLDCVYMRGTVTSKGQWANSLCSVEVAYICEMPTGSCPAGWLRFGGHCYKFNYDTANWSAARGRCKLQNSRADLVVIDNFAEQLWLQDRIDFSADAIGFWIGLNSNQQKNVFVWLNTTTVAQYTNWDARMPSYTKSEACVAATGSYRAAQWKDEECGRKLGYLCEKPAEGDASYYDFKYNASIYKVLLSKFTPMHGEEYCQKVLGVNASLILIDGDDELNYIKRELDARGHVGSSSKRFWTRGKANVTSSRISTSTPNPSGPRLPDYSSRNCLELWFESYGPWQTRSYRPKLRAKACCQETYIICEKHIDPKLTMDNKYDFSLNSSIYRLVDEKQLEHNDSLSECGILLDNSGSLAEFETWEELEAVSKEVLARHVGEHFIYWVAGDPLDENTTSVVPKTERNQDSHCLVLEFDPAKAATSFDSTMTLRSTKCEGKKKFLCEQKGINTNIGGVSDSVWTHMKNVMDDPNYRAKFYSNTGCTGPCIGLAVALPFVAIGAVLITVAYFWFIKRQSPFAVLKFSREDDEVRLT